MSKGTYEAHTATFGPGDPETEPTSYLGAIAARFEAPGARPARRLPERRRRPPRRSRTGLHGNGFWNSGVMDKRRASAAADVQRA